MSGSGETVVSRRNVARDSNSTSDTESAFHDDNKKDDDSKQTRFSLMEEILLLGLKDREGYTSFWNDNISFGLRGCFLIELALRGRIALEPPSRRLILNRNVIVIKNLPTGDMLLDEALRTISSNKPADVKSWIEYLSGETWNPFKIALQMRNVRERIAKNLVDKGVCSTEKQNFILFDMTTHPLINTPAKQLIIQRLNDAVLNNWTTDISRMNKRLLSLIVVAHRADVLENAFLTLSNQEYSMAMKRVRSLLDLNCNEYGSTGTPADVIWAVFAALSS